MTALAFVLRYWKLILGGLAIAALGLMLLLAKADARHWEKKFNSEREAFQLTVADYRAKADEARRLDAANKARVEAEQKAITERASHDYQAQIAAVRERYAGLVRRASAANNGGGNDARMPRSSPTPSGPDAAAPQDGLPLADALIASEQALQLQALQAWVSDQSKVTN